MLIKLRHLPLMFSGLLMGCWGRNIPYEGGDTAGAVETVECGADVDTTVGFRIEGVITDLETGELAAEGLCITAIDPSNGLTGGTPEVLAASQICADGQFVVANVEEAPAVGMFLVVDDCEGEADTVMQTASGIPAEDIVDLSDGDVLSGVAGVVISAGYQATIDAEIEALEAAAGDTDGAAETSSEEGYLAGFILDSAGQPVPGATVQCGGCTAYYFDDDASDGLLSAGGVVNSASTDAGIFIIPGAAIYNYTFSDGGAHTWGKSLGGSLPGYAVFIWYYAE